LLLQLDQFSGQCRDLACHIRLASLWGLGQSAQYFSLALARLWRDNQDESGTTIKMRRSGRMEDDCRWPRALQAD